MNSLIDISELSYQGHKKGREGALDDAMKLKMEALDIVKDDPDELLMICSLYSDISHLYNRLDRIEDAKRYGKKAETILGKIRDPDVRTFIGVRTHSAYTICKDMAHGRAIDTIEHTKRDLEKRGLLGKKAEAYLEEAEGLIYLNLFDYKEAEVHFDNARFAYADIWNADPELVEVREREMKMRFPAAGVNIGKQLVKEGIYPILLTRGGSSQK